MSGSFVLSVLFFLFDVMIVLLKDQYFAVFVDDIVIAILFFCSHHSKILRKKAVLSRPNPCSLLSQL